MTVVLDKAPSEPRETIELKASKDSKQAAAAPTVQDRINAAIYGSENAPEPTAIGSGGAAAAAGVLTAVDEDEEGAEEAPVPEDFDYYTDAE